MINIPAAALATLALSTAALAQQFANPGFETGDLTGWTINPTPVGGGQTMVQTVELFDIDGPGPLPPSPAAKFSVGAILGTPTQTGGIDLVQELTLSANSGYRISYNWAITNIGPHANSDGGHFAILAGERLIAARPTGSIHANGQRFGSIEAFLIPGQSGPLTIGARITRDANITSVVAAELHQWIDNMHIEALPLGACCRPYQGCIITAGPDHCDHLGGDYLGNATTCPPAAPATCQPTYTSVSTIPMPGFDSTSSNATVAWGHWFTAPADFTIVGLRIPDESGQQFQNVEVVRLNATPPLGSGTPTNAFTSLFRRVGHAGDDIIESTIHITEGDIIGILGNRGTSTMHHSIGEGGFESQIAGQPLLLRRLMMGGHLNLLPARNLYTSGIITATLARIEVHYDAPGACYADCDDNDVLNIDDFLCFINAFAQAQVLPHASQVTHYANCDGSTSQPVLTIDDFLCFINEFAQGCP